MNASTPNLRYPIGLIAVIAGIASAVAQTPTTTKEPVVLSAFEVSATAGAGYRTSNAASGTKSQKPLIELPSSVAIVTRDFIDDMVSRQTIGDILKFSVAGAPPATNRNNFLQLRGQRFEAPFMDGMRVSNSPNELSTIESIEILKGPNAILYGTRAPAGGLVNRITKKPLYEAAQNVKLQVGSYGFYRGEADLTGPLGGPGAKFAYRLVAAKQEDKGYRGRYDQDALSPMLQFTSHNTILRYQFMWAETFTLGKFPGGIANPDGTPFLGGGRNQDYRAPWSYTLEDTSNHVFTWIQRWGDWDSRLAYGHDQVGREDEEYRRQGPVNFTTGLANHRYFGQSISQLFQNLQQDISGYYNIGTLAMATNAGWSWQRQLDKRDRQQINLVNGQRIGAFSRATTGTPGVGQLSITNPNFAAIPLPASQDRIVRGQYNDSRVDVRNFTAYLVQSFDPIPDRLSLTLGASFVNEKSDNQDLPDGTQLAARRRDKDDDLLYSVGAVYHVSDAFKLYGQTATTFSPNQASAQTPQGVRPPAVVGKSYEVGAKWNLLEDSLWGTFSLYELNLEGFATYNSAIDAFVVTDTSNRGAEFELGARPVPGWDVILTGFIANVSGPNDTRVNQSFKETWSLWTKYTFGSGAAAGWYVGGGAFHRGTLYFATGANSPGYTSYDLIAGYNSRRWSIAVRAVNVNDALYNIGSTGGGNIDISLPPHYQATFTFRF
jgi:iron complex outermembrane recepter protein